MRHNVESNPSLNQKLRLLENCFRRLILGGQITVPVEDRKLGESTDSFHKCLKPRGAGSFALCFPLFFFFDSLFTSNYIKTKVILNCVSKAPSSNWILI